MFFLQSGFSAKIVPSSKTDRIKEELGWLKIVFAIFVAVDVSLMAWLAQNYDELSQVLTVCGFLGVVFVTSVVFGLTRLRLNASKSWRKNNGLVCSSGIFRIPYGLGYHRLRFIQTWSLIC